MKYRNKIYSKMYRNKKKIKHRLCLKGKDDKQYFMNKKMENKWRSDRHKRDNKSKKKMDHKII